MSPEPADFLAHLEELGYHPRSDKHSNLLAKAVVDDLVRHCPAIREAAASGRLVYDLNRSLRVGTADWNVDLVLGEPALQAGSQVESDRDQGTIARQPPSTVQIAVEFKSVMTEHKKAIKNRKRDFEAHHDHVHRYSDRAIAGGLLVINGSGTFRSPLRHGEITQHRDPPALVDHCIREFRAVTVRSGTSPVGLDAKGVLVIDFDNQGGEASYLTGRSVPQVGDPLHYDACIQAICNRYGERFG